MVHFSHVSFPDFASAFLILFPLVLNTLRQRMFYILKYIKNIATVHCTMLNMGFV